MAATTYVRARIDEVTKERASRKLNAMGLSVSDAIRLLMVQVAEQDVFPLVLHTPNALTRDAMTELEAGEGKTAETVDALLADLNDD